ncbi:hypothetical protein [Peribacillus sp. FSL M8-0224]|uniref:hypothetical protein n=1 Tax=Peribacillus sp. FSL M8-0224 TaxID=2921568 RepID=UPI0030F87615
MFIVDTKVLPLRIDEESKVVIEHASITRAIEFAIEQPSDFVIIEMIIRQNF